VEGDFAADTNPNGNGAQMIAMVQQIDSSFPSSASLSHRISRSGLHHMPSGKYKAGDSGAQEILQPG
jgi:hypothetical protein